MRDILSPTLPIDCCHCAADYQQWQFHLRRLVTRNSGTSGKGAGRHRKPAFEFLPQKASPPKRLPSMTATRASQSVFFPSRISALIGCLVGVNIQLSARWRRYRSGSTARDILHGLHGSCSKHGKSRLLDSEKSARNSSALTRLLGAAKVRYRKCCYLDLHSSREALRNL